MTSSIAFKVACERFASIVWPVTRPGLNKAQFDIAAAQRIECAIRAGKLTAFADADLSKPLGQLSENQLLGAEPSYLRATDFESWLGAEETVTEAFAKLCDALREQQGKLTRGANPDADLSVMRHTLNTILDFLAATVDPIDADLTDPLLTLHGELQNVADGRMSNVLAPRKKSKGQPSKPVTWESHWAVGAAAIDLLMKDEGLSLDDAARQVERAFDNLGIPLPGSTRQKAKKPPLQTWRARLLERRKSDATLALYKKTVVDARNQYGADAAKYLLETLAAVEVS